jgi:hypothetical protein
VAGLSLSAILWIRAIQWSEAERDKTIDVAKLVSRKAERDHLKQKLGELNRMPREALRREAAEQRQAMLMAHRSPKELAVLAAINRHR